MSATRTPWRTALVGLVLVVGLALVGPWLRRQPDAGCALDGEKIDPIYRVTVTDAGGGAHDFCCLTCARLWLKRQADPPRSVTVTDEASGQGIDAAAAYFVRSSVVTTPTTGNRTHAFRNRADAQKHADEFGGTVLADAETLFRFRCRAAPPRR
jgi:hypothetical protein